MKAAEEKATEYAEREIPIAYTGETKRVHIEELRQDVRTGYLAGYAEAMRWRDPKEELPEFISGCDYSNNVLAHVEGFTETQVMCLLFVPDDEGGWGYVWANCYGDINGEAEWDDDYKVIGWRPIE